MKKSITIFSIIMLSAVAAFSQARVGAMLGYGSEVEQWGLGANAEFMINDRMGLAPNLFFYFPDNINGSRLSFWELNADFHYYFLNEDFIGLYGLGGLNLTTAKLKTDDVILTDNTHSELGVNLGLGANFDAGSFIPFAELKYIVGDADQAVVFVGVKFPLNADID
jgi:outer membrane immunogenic protein